MFAVDAALFFGVGIKCNHPERLRENIYMAAIVIENVSNHQRRSKVQYDVCYLPLARISGIFKAERGQSQRQSQTTHISIIFYTERKIRKIPF